MHYKEHVPAALLRPYVECYWEFSSGNDPVVVPEVQRCLPLGTLEIIVQTTQRPCEILHKNGRFEKSANVYLTGLYTGTAIWRPGEDTPMFGIRLKPEGLIRLFGQPVSVCLNSVFDAEVVLGSPVKTMCDEMAGVKDSQRLIAIAERYLLGRLDRRNDKFNYAVSACKVIRDSAGVLSVEALARQLFVSRRQLERSFRDDIGTSPKTYQRIIRFRNAYALARASHSGERSWTQISYASGYADQAHFIRDFKAFTGQVPSTLNSQPASFFQTLESLGLSAR
ncbi:helix-turn-helix transcriptional regulator [Pedobacter deserti]|uniref:helix-turn-helix transcriptional regulator n=1 Tax=Pedobacter deserti TaxID=2817382 RepID=UPI0021099DB4|nr:helix-turn-helix transcriptional regulator [Pedobacter sp. SYSU D00382]